MSDFYELALPREEQKPPNNGRWFVTVDISKTNFQGCLLNDGSAVEEIAAVGQDNTRFYFNTILGAHVNADNYYKRNNQTYPFQDEWDQAILDDIGKKPKTLTIESEVMEFI